MGSACEHSSFSSLGGVDLSKDLVEKSEVLEGCIYIDCGRDMYAIIRGLTIKDYVKQVLRVYRDDETQLARQDFSQIVEKNYIQRVDCDKRTKISQNVEINVDGDVKSKINGTHIHDVNTETISTGKIKHTGYVLQKEDVEIDGNVHSNGDIINDGRNSAHHSHEG